ncbi:hypothetical protein L1987_70389 [Smallanthus sonchifolius]|uniref:Uncharacterized protein n=1 Tax=Smallanthus sonchifolius TaxID=185202 RepID=A0ACB9AQ21_9ASTR|nr:hypothetical protein L1987_70389 [Smallanthus sonchifolius]
MSFSGSVVVYVDTVAVDLLTLVSNTIKHKYDKHSITLSYSPVENHEGDYFGEVCKEKLNPNASFYHCHECVQSIHSACAPLIAPTKAYICGAFRVPHMDKNITRFDLLPTHCPAQFPST